MKIDAVIFGLLTKLREELLAFLPEQASPVLDALGFKFYPIIDYIQGQPDFERYTQGFYSYNEKTDTLILLYPDRLGKERYTHGLIEVVEQKIREKTGKPCEHVIKFVIDQQQEYDYLTWKFHVYEELRGHESHYSQSFELSNYNSLNSINCLVTLVRYLQYFCGDYSAITSQQEYQEQVSTALAMSCNLSKITINRIQCLNPEPDTLFEILKQQSPDTSQNFEAQCLKREILCFRAIYAARVAMKQDFLGIGRSRLFGAFSAQEKINAIDKFLNDEQQPLDKAGEQGQLGKLIEAYQKASLQTSHTIGSSSV